MAPSAMPDTMPMHRPLSTKGSTISASILHGPRDLRLEPRILEEPGPGELQVAVRSTGICGSDVSYYQKFANGDLCACAPLSLGHESSGVVVAVGPPLPSQQQEEQRAGGGRRQRQRRFAVGDRVALEVGVPCARCGICRQGRYNLCKRMRFRSSAKTVPHFQGTLQERINHPAVWCHKLPDHVSFDAAALLEPLSVAIHAVNRASPAPGSTALVIGAGTVGLLTAAMARQSGCTTVTISDIDAGRVDYALRKGFATHGFVVPRPSHVYAHTTHGHNNRNHDPPSGSKSKSNSNEDSSSFYTTSGRSTPQLLESGAATPSSTFSSSSSPSSSSADSNSNSSIHERLEGAKALAASILSVTRISSSSLSTSDRGEEEEEDDDDDDDDDHAGVDVTFECTGKEVCMHTSLYATRPGGKVIMVGMGTPIQTLPVSVAHLKEVDILGIFRYANTYPTGIRLLCAAQSQERRHGMAVPAGVDGLGVGGGGGLLPSLDDMVTHRFKGLGAAKHAFELAGRTVDDDGNLVLKVVIEA